MVSRAVARYFAHKHVVVTGGSEGLGLEIARQLARLQARVSLIARTESKLAAAASSIASEPGSQKDNIHYATADVSQYQQVEAAVAACRVQQGPVDILICCAGAAECGYFHKQDPGVFLHMMQLNYMGCVHAAKAVAAEMLGRDAGHMCFVSSAMGLLGMVGYSAYAPSKFAVRGFAECLRNEFQGTGVSVSIAFPGDVDTPGYARENRTKPVETAKLSEGTLNPPEKVASALLSGMAAKQFQLSNPILLLGILQSVCAGLVPRRLLRLPWEMLLGVLSPLICWATAAEHDALCRKTAAQRFAGLHE